MTSGPLALTSRRSMIARLPRHVPGMKIGLFGGSFNPPHAGHLLVSATALRRLGLDAVWWLVTPGNPLKENSGLPSLSQRMAAARVLIDDPRIVVSDIEARIGTRFTYDTIAYLKQRCPGVRFVWLMGADNLASFHRWQHWLDIASLVPFAAIDRPGSTLKAIASPAAQRLKAYRLSPQAARLLPLARPPAWTFLHGRRSTLSSTALRENGHGVAPHASKAAEGD